MLRPEAPVVDLHLGNLSRLSPSVSRSISAENPGGDAGGGGRAAAGTGQAAARGLGPGWKVSPAVPIEPGQTRLLADIGGPGAIRHIWMGVNGDPRFAILRFVWDGSGVPSVECPAGHFFACGWGGVEPVSSLAVCMNPRNGFNCWWEMPFRGSCRITVENVGPEPIALYYQVDYTLGAVPDDRLCFHARFHRSDPLGDGGAHAVLDGTRGRGQYVGTYLAWQPCRAGEPVDWRIEFHVDGKGGCGEVRSTTLEAYLCRARPAPSMSGAAAFEGFSTPWCGAARATGPEGTASPAPRFGFYRWHVMDPIRFEKDLCVVIRAPGPEAAGVGTPAGDLASVAYWYQRS